VPHDNHSDLAIPVLTDVLVPGGAMPAGPRDYAPARATPQAAGQDDLVAARLEERLRGYLHGEGRALIAARCREALELHTTQLVERVARDVTAALEARLTEWVREAVREHEHERPTPTSR
jgi:hypothetical protein